MQAKMMEAGQIVNTHGIRGEVKIQPWCDSADFLAQFDTYYINGAPVRVLERRVHKSCLLVALEGVTNVNAAMALKGKVVSVDRSGIVLPEGQHFIADLIGLKVENAADGSPIGVLTDVLNLPANDVYVVKGEQEYMIPVVAEFVKAVDLDAGIIRVSLIPGMATEGGASHAD